MSLRFDSVYRVDHHGSSGSQPSSEGDHHEAAQLPKVLQIRLTEQALHQLADAYTNSNSGDARIRIDVSLNDPLLVIGDTFFPLHASLPASGSQSRTTAPDAASTSTAPHELYRLSEDESTLYRIGAIATKFSVKPYRDVSAMAQRLKQQKEEEEHRKEERRKALMAGASPQLSTSSSSRLGINKTLASARSASASPFLTSSPLSRSSSLSKISIRREPNLLNSASLSRGVSREPSPGARDIQKAVGQSKLQAVSYNAGTSVRHTNRATTDLPKVATVANSRSSSLLHDPNPFLSSSGSRSKITLGRSVAVEEDGQSSEDDRERRKTVLSSPAAGGSDSLDGAAKKSAKLTTRQRLAKATKAGSRLLAAAERRATPESRATPTVLHASPPLKVGAPGAHLHHESSKSAPTAAHSQSLTKGKAKETATSALLRRAHPQKHEKPVDDRRRRTTEDDRERQIPPTSAPFASKIRDEPSPARKRQAESSRLERVADAERGASVSASSSRVSAASAKQKAIDGKARRDDPDPAEKESRNTNGQTSKGVTKPAFKVESPSPVQVVTMRKARPSETSDSAMAKARTTESSSASKPSRKPDAENSAYDCIARGDMTRKHDELMYAGPRPASASPTKQATTRRSGDEPTDTTERKRRRTNEFIPSGYSVQHREKRRSISPDLSNQRSDQSLTRQRESSRDRHARRQEPASPRDRQTRGRISVSASTPSFASSSTRLQPVNEGHDREATRSKAGEYHDRRRDRSYDEVSYYNHPSRDRNERSYRGCNDGQRRHAADDEARDSPRVSSSHPSADKQSSTSAERPTKGVGPGATHWSEPWLDVRSKADWHRLAQRFAKTQAEYLAFWKRLEAESERLDRELELAALEEPEASRRPLANGDVEVPAEQSLFFSPHKAAASDGDIVMRDLEAETAINTSVYSRIRGSTKPKSAQDGDESPEEGEMRSSDDEEGRVDDVETKAFGAVSSDHRSTDTASSTDSLMLASRRSESPNNVAGRTSPTRNPSQATRNLAPVGTGTDRPLSYIELANRVQQLEELHGSLSRMHRVLIDFKAKGLAS
ncbi:uncharacterized protein MEPE_00241 [Melanopsichium pennsylvanicum]|uniref:Uncharacterized protein n=2 Tax=Melanopsichium pennsylvanicum TaxID=63383 RepID=A0AAJ4XGZ0_9BASI|nr:putative protein [Melanopsichium pennsylvanicum 4]SNX81536.1 uncharacterized protein MEPE_00241 [Melanopsichium pennsylvanicum]